MPDVIAIPAAAAGAETVSGRRVVHVMGTVVSFDLRDEVPLADFEAAVGFLHEADRRFSTYRTDSEISRLQRGEVTVADCHPDAGQVLQRCAHAAARTDGYFTVAPHGRLDPTGLVKGWAVERASEILCAAGSRRHAVNGGGDIQLVSDPSSDLWRVGIADPRSRSTVLAVAALANGGIATSGAGERGHHIVDPHTGRAADHFASVTITAMSLTEADVLATAAFAKGSGALDWIEALSGIEGLFVERDGTVRSTPGFPFAPQA